MIAMVCLDCSQSFDFTPDDAVAGRVVSRRCPACRSGVRSDDDVERALVLVDGDRGVPR